MKTKSWSIVLGLMLILSLSACGKKEETKTNPTPTTSPEKTATKPETQPEKTDTKKAGVAPEKNGVDCPKDAPIKALTTKKRGKIYHSKKFPDYKKVKPETCFKDVASAEKAGYKKP